MEPRPEDAVIEAEPVRQEQLLIDLREAITKQSKLLNDVLSGIHQGIANQSNIINEWCRAMHEGIANQSSLLNDKLGDLSREVGRLTTVLETELARRLDATAVPQPAERRIPLPVDPVG